MKPVRIHTTAQPGFRQLIVALVLSALLPAGLHATPANKRALTKHFADHLPSRLNDCSTCHLPGGNKAAESLEEFPHNPFGDRLRRIGESLDGHNLPHNLAQRLKTIETEDSDGDGTDNLTELLLGTFPGDPGDTPDTNALRDADERKAAFARYLAANDYPWRPFRSVRRPDVPRAGLDSETIVNPIDAFISARHKENNLTPQPRARPEILIRRLYIDLIGLSPTPDELAAFRTNPSDHAYEQLVDRLLAHPRYGERWGRHWMDIWRYSDWSGYRGTVRDSKPHIWHWRDWIVQSLNSNKPYNRMIVEMLAGDELDPLNRETLSATGFLVRNWKAGRREQQMTELIEHTFQAFTGLTMACAKCHDHKYDPISHEEYYQVRAIFEGHDIRTDRIPGEPDTDKDGLPRAYARTSTPTTYFLERGDARFPVKDKKMEPAIPAVFGTKLEVEPVKLPLAAYVPDKRDFVIRETLAASENSVSKARTALASTEQKGKKATPGELEQARLALEAAEAEHQALLATLKVEDLEDRGRKDTDEWSAAASVALEKQRTAELLTAKNSVIQAEAAEARAKSAAEKARQSANGKSTSALKKAESKWKSAQKRMAEAEKALTQAKAEMDKPVTTQYTPRKLKTHPSTSPGRRLAFARWLADNNNPLTARVAVNHIWLRHFGSALVPTVNEFGNHGARPTHPALLDWLAAEFMERGWDMKALHKSIVMSQSYRRASTHNPHNHAIDPDNQFLWRMNARRMEGEIVRDNLLHITGALNNIMGGPDIPNTEGQTSRRTSIHLRHAHEKLVEFIQIFDGPSVVECYQRKVTVQPHQALALANGNLTFTHARRLGNQLATAHDQDADFLRHAFVRILNREPEPEEVQACGEFLQRQTDWLEQNPPAGESGTPSPEARARINLVMTLFNHNDFVTVR